MKQVLLSVFVLALVCTFKTNAQIGVTKFGTNALVTNAANADYNTGLGYYALGANTSGNRNTAIGANALRYNTTGIYNTALGAAALYRNTAASYNSAVGSYALFSNTGGYQNTALGSESLYFNTTGAYNTATGYQALYNNTTGSFNTANGAGSLFDNIIGASNTADGANAMYANTTGSRNTANGYGALSSNKTGDHNTAVGYYSLHTIKTGSRNTALGTEAGPSSDVSNSTAIGYGAIPTGSNRVRIGNALVTSIGGQVGWSILSDGRYKKDAKENVPGLAFINSLRPVTYSNAKTIYNGFVPEEVALAAKKLHFEFSGVDKPETKDGMYGLRYDNFISPLVKSVQELSAKNENDSSIVDLQNLVGDLQNQVNELRILIEKKMALTK